MTSWESPFAERIPWSSAQWLVSHQHPFVNKWSTEQSWTSWLTFPELLFCFHRHFNVRHGEGGANPRTTEVSSRATAGCRRVKRLARGGGC